MGARTLARGADRCGQVGTEWAPLGARELGHDALLSGCWSWVVDGWLVFGWVPVREPDRRAVPLSKAARCKSASCQKEARQSPLTGTMWGRPEYPIDGGRIRCSTTELRPQGRRDSNPRPAGEE